MRGSGAVPATEASAVQPYSPKWGEVSTFARTYPGKAEQVRLVRADLRLIFRTCPVVDDLVLLASELCANAVAHSNSREPGGQFILRTQACPGDYVWIEVEDEGGPWTDREHDDDRPHGLDIVRAVAGDDNCGIDGDGPFPRVVWFRLDWPVTP